MTMVVIWCITGFLWVFFFPARSVPSQWAQLVLGGPIIWTTMGVLYWKGTESLVGSSAERSHGLRRALTENSNRMPASRSVDRSSHSKR